MYATKTINLKMMTTTKMIMTKIFSVYLFVDILLIVLAIFMGGLWLINTQIAFICSMLIAYSSFLSYKKMVQKRLEDPSITETDLPKSSGRSMENLANSSRGALSLWRLLAYALLFVAILVLIRKDLFEPIAFILGVSVLPLATLVNFLGRH